MPTPSQILANASPRHDQIEVGREFVDALRPEDEDQTIATIRRAFAWSAPLLSIASMLDRGVTIPEIRHRLDDSEWIERLGDSLGRFTSIGVLSMGRATTAVLSSANLNGRLPAQVFVAKRSVRQGLAFLDAPILLHPPEEATALLLPMFAMLSTGEAVVSAAHAEPAAQATLNGAVVIPVSHPMCRLGTEDTGRFQPSSEFSRVAV